MIEKYFNFKQESADVVGLFECAKYYFLFLDDCAAIGSNARVIAVSKKSKRKLLKKLKSLNLAYNFIDCNDINNMDLYEKEDYLFIKESLLHHEFIDSEVESFIIFAKLIFSNCATQDILTGFFGRYEFKRHKFFCLYDFICDYKIIIKEKLPIL